MIARFLYMAGGALAGLFLVVALAAAPEPMGGILLSAVAVVVCSCIGWELADRSAFRSGDVSNSWTAQRCWEILGDDRNPLAMQERAAARLARLGRGVVATTERNWWPWRARQSASYPFDRGEPRYDRPLAGYNPPPDRTQPLPKPSPAPPRKVRP